MQPRKQLLLAATSNCKDFATFYINLKETANGLAISKKAKRRLKFCKVIDYMSDFMQELNLSECKLFWKNTATFCYQSLHVFALHMHQRIDSDTKDDENFKEAIQLLESVCLFCLAFIQVENPKITDELLEVVSILYSSLLNFTAAAHELAELVCTLCVEWWSLGLQNKNDLCLSALIFLFNEILETEASAKKSTSKYVNQLHQIKGSIFHIIANEKHYKEDQSNLEELENIQELRQLLTSAFIHPAFLKVKNGRKFLSSILLLDQELLTTIHNTILNRLLVNHNCNEAYGNIYCLAWSQANELMKEKLEEYCIQDVMFRAMHVPHGKDLFNTFRSILASIACQNGALPVRHMLTRLYNPIIWRSLKATNAMVRANAACLFFDAFPLRNSSDSGEERDAFLQKQFTAIDDLIMDPFPQVRSIAVCGLFNILNLYWDVIPAQVIAIQCRNLYTNLAFDKSVAVRVGVFKGTVVLLSNPCCHPLLKKLLPVISRCIHDRSEKVRVAMFKVLLAVKQTSTIKFWDVCAVKNILAQLEVEGRSGSNYIVRLITGSFLPQDQPVQTWVERCVNFYKRNTNAARKFYLFAKDNLSANELGDFIFMLSVFLFNSVSKSLSEEVEEEEESEDSFTQFSEDSQTATGLLETISILWMEFSNKTNSISRSKGSGDSDGDEKSSLRELTKRLMLQLPRMTHVCFRKFHDERTLNALLHLSSCLLPASMPVFSKKVLPKLRSLPDDSPESYYGMLIKCLVKWNWSKQLLELISDWLARSITKSNANSEQVEPESGSTKEASTNMRSKEKCVQFEELAEEASRPQQALKYLHVILDKEDTVLSLLSNEPCMKLLEEISFYLQSCTSELVGWLHGRAPHADGLDMKLMLECVRLYFKLTSHFYLYYNNKDTEPCNAEAHLHKLKELIGKVESEVINQLKSSLQINDTPNASVLSTTLPNQSQQSSSSSLSKLTIFKEFLQISFSSSLMFLQQGIPVATAILSLISAFTETGIKTVDYGEWLCKLLKELLECFLLYSWSVAQDEASLKLVEEEAATLLQVFDDIMVALMMFSRRNPDGFGEKYRVNFRSNLRTFVHIASEHSSQHTKLFFRTLARKIISAVLADLAHHNIGEEAKCFSDLPLFSSSFISLLCASSTDCHHIFRHTLPDIFSGPHTEERTSAANSCRVLLKVLSKDGKYSSVVMSYSNELQQILGEKSTSQSVGRS